MKKFFACCLTFLLFGTTCFARDFIVEFVDENYKETQASFSYSPIIYHSIQVSSQAGPKLLILKGDDYHYRNWLRQFIAKGEAFVVKVPDDKADLFITSSAFEIDVTNVFPMNMAKYRQGEEKNRTAPDRFDPQRMYGASGGRSDAGSGLDQMRENQRKAQKDQIRQTRALEAQAKNKQLEKQKALSQKQSVEDAKKKQAEKALEEKLAKDREKILEKEKQEQAKILAKIAEQRTLEDQQRRQDFEQRWQMLKRRLLEDEKIKSLERGERERELKRRWLELRDQLGIQ